MSGFQDITLAAKYDFYRHSFNKVGNLSLIGVVAGSIPLTDYTPDFQPLSIGFASKQISTRFTANLQTKPGWFVNGSAAYTWRGNVTLDRPYYFTENGIATSFTPSTGSSMLSQQVGQRVGFSGMHQVSFVVPYRSVQFCTPWFFCWATQKHRVLEWDAVNQFADVSPVARRMAFSAAWGRATGTK